LVFSTKITRFNLSKLLGNQKHKYNNFSSISDLSVHACSQGVFKRISTFIDIPILNIL